MTELRFALRQLLKSPSFTIVAVLALAIGIGANTAIFSVINAVLLKPLPFPQAEQLVALGSTDAREPNTRGLNSISFPDFKDFRAQSQSFVNLAAFRADSIALGGGSEAQSLRAERVTAEFFDVLGVPPQLGRGFRGDEEAAGGGPIGLVVVLSYDFWRRQFNGAPNAVGSVLILDGEPHMVVGVMPKGFQFPIQTNPPDVYTTTSSFATASGNDKPATEVRGNHMMQAVGRLKPSAKVVQAQAELRTIAAALAQTYPDSNTNFSVSLLPLREKMVGDVSGALYVLFGAVGCVLLIAIANVANLLLARATVRAKEIALRSALGASRGRIIRQLLTESVVLSALGGLLGLIFAAWGTDVLVGLIPENIPRISAIRLDGMVLAFTFIISLATGILFGLVPAFQASRLDLQKALNESGRGAINAGSHNRLRGALVIGEVALALILLTGAGLLLQSFSRLSQVDPGLRSDRLFTAFISLPQAAYPRPENVWNFQDQLLSQLRTLPGVQSVSTILPLPLSESNMTTSFDLEERPLPEGQQAVSPVRIAGKDYFATAGVPLLSGRLFDSRDLPKSKLVMIVNQRFADKFFPGENAIGKRIAPGMSMEESTPQREIIGVVGNVKHLSLREELTPEMYLPATQMPSSLFALVLRTSTANPTALTASVRAEMARIDPGVPLTRVKVFQDYITRALARPRFNALLLGIFAGVALLLTAIGIYGVMAYSVAQRRHEIGIRMALGAQRGDVLRLIVGGGMKLTALGVAIGLSGAFALTRVLRSLLFGIEPFDALTLCAVAFLLCAIALLACWFPARRAASVNPLIALREG